MRISALVLLGWLTVSLLAGLLELNPYHINLPSILKAPDFDSMEGLFGFDELGRPVLDRMLVGGRLSFVVAITVVSISLVIGTLIGAFSAWVGGWVDLVIMRIVDVFLAFPGILLAIALAAMLGPGIENVIVALCAVGWVGFARLARAQTLSLKAREHVRAAVALGATDSRVLFIHVVPLMAAPLLIEATFGLASVVVAEAGLSFLGVGVQPPEPSWGSLIREGTRYMLVAPHLVLIPSFALCTVVVAVNLLGDGLRDRLDVRHQARRGDSV